MSRPLLKIDITSALNENLSLNLREFSPIRKNTQAEISENSSKKIFSKQEEISPGCRKTIANTFIKSFSSSNSDLPNININQLTEITEKVRKLEENLDINLYLLKEKLDLNQQLSQKLQVWKKLKERMKNFSIKLNKILKLALMNADFFNNQVHSKLNK